MWRRLGRGRISPVVASSVSVFGIVAIGRVWDFTQKILLIICLSFLKKTLFSIKVL